MKTFALWIAALGFAIAPLGAQAAQKPIHHKASLLCLGHQEDAYQWDHSCSDEESATSTEITHDANDSAATNTDIPPSPIWQNYTFTAGNEDFAISFPANPGVQVSEFEEFALFYSPGTPFLSLVATPTDANDEDPASFVGRWTSVLSEKYSGSTVYLLGETAGQINGFDGVDAIFNVLGQDLFVRVRLLVSTANNYVFETTFAAEDSDTSSYFFDSFSVQQ